jgi:hypothetical protein
MAKFFIHRENSEYGGSRTDLAVTTDDGVILQVFTIGVENGNTPGACFRPFTLKENIKITLEKIEKFNSIPAGAVCPCGATNEYHTRSAVCTDFSELREIDFREATVLAVKAKRHEVGEAILDHLRRLYRQGEIY